MWRAIRTMIARGLLDRADDALSRRGGGAGRSRRRAGGGRLIASRQRREIRSVVSRKQISCSTTLTEDEIRPGRTWSRSRGDAGRLQITVVDAEAVVRRLLASDRTVRDLEVRRAGLAEAFIEITKEAA